MGGYIEAGGGILFDSPRSMDRSYLQKYIPFPQGFLADSELSLTRQDGLEYYKFRMSYLGSRNQDYLLQAGKLGVFHAEIEYDTMQNLYCSVNPFNNSIGILVQRLRFSGWYSPTRMPELTLFVENDLLRRTGWQPSSINTGPGNPYNFVSGSLRPINYTQNDLRVGVEYDQEKQTDQQSVFQGRVSYHLSTFDNGQNNFLGRTAPSGGERLCNRAPKQYRPTT